MQARSNLLERSQKKLFFFLQQELEQFNIHHDKAIRSYERSFQNSLPSTFSVSNIKDLTKKIKEANVVLVGDFHPFRQSQKGFLRLVNQGGNEKKQIFIALECVQRAKQAALDHYSMGRITIEELREELEFEKEWPFPWTNYREIIELAKNKGFRLLALNIQEKNRSPLMLKTRDKAAAEAISHCLKNHPKAQIFALYGELHLAKNHLPESLDGEIKKHRIVVIHQNNTSLFWKAPFLKSGQKAEILKLRNNEYCLFNAVPWIKLKSYLDWIEGGQGDEPWSDTSDFTEITQKLAKHLAEIIDIKTEISEQIEILDQDLSRLTKIGIRKTKDEKKYLAYAKEYQRTIFIPEKKVILVSSSSTNSLTEGAALLLWHSNAPASIPPIPSGGPRLLLAFFVGFLGSKLLNPRRKCEEISDIKHFLDKNSLSSSSIKNRKINTYRRALQIFHAQKSCKSKWPKKVLRGTLELEAIRICGYLMANKIFLSLQRDPKILPFLRNIFLTSCSSDKKAFDALEKIHRIIRTQSSANRKT